jgi:hypothetical protein
LIWIAVPICVAMADTSFSSPDVNGDPLRRPERITTPSGTAAFPGLVQRIGTESIDPCRYGSDSIEVADSTIDARCSRNTLAVSERGSCAEIGTASFGSNPIAVTTWSVSVTRS